MPPSSPHAQPPNHKITPILFPKYCVQSPHFSRSVPPKLAKTDSRKPKGKADTELPVFCLGNCTEVRSLSTWGQTGLGSSPSTALTGRGISGLQALTVSTCERTMPLGPTSRGAVRVQWRCTWLRAHWLERGKESAHLSCPQQCLPCTSFIRPDLWTRQPNGSTSARCTSASPFTSALKPLLTTALGRSWQEAPVGCLVSVPSLCPVHPLVLGWQGARWQGCLVPGFPQMVSPCRQQQCALDERCLGGEDFSSLFLTR